MNIVLSTYIFPSRLRDGKSCVSVAIGLIGAYYTIFSRHDAELFVKREISLTNAIFARLSVGPAADAARDFLACGVVPRKRQEQEPFRDEGIGDFLPACVKERVSGRNGIE